MQFLILIFSNFAKWVRLSRKWFAMLQFKEFRLLSMRKKKRWIRISKLFLSFFVKVKSQVFYQLKSINKTNQFQIGNKQSYSMKYSLWKKKTWKINQIKIIKKMRIFLIKIWFKSKKWNRLVKMRKSIPKNLNIFLLINIILTLLIIMIPSLKTRKVLVI